MPFLCDRRLKQCKSILKVAESPAMGFIWCRRWDQTLTSMYGLLIEPAQGLASMRQRLCMDTATESMHNLSQTEVLLFSMGNLHLGDQWIVQSSEILTIFIGSEWGSWNISQKNLYIKLNCYFLNKYLSFAGLLHFKLLTNFCPRSADQLVYLLQSVSLGL